MVVFNTLEEVMDFTTKAAVRDLISPRKPDLANGKLNLTQKEIAEIIAFMKS
jgi:hypothetical protein